MRLPLLNADTVLGYLQGRGHLDAIAGSQIRVRDLSRRNHNLAVELDGHAGWFIKQIQYDTPEVLASLEREAHCYTAAQERGALAPLVALMPRCVEFDAENCILILVLIDGVNAAEAHQRVGPFDTRIAGMLGQTIGTLHRALPLDPSIRELFPQQLPWILRPVLDSECFSSRSRFLSLFVSDAAIARALAEVRATWCHDTLIHGDTRQDNFLFCRSRDDSVALDTRFVDWELAGIGDAAWDCANTMQYYWTQWASIHPPTPQTWNALAFALKEFWSAYNAGLGLAGTDARRMFRRVTFFAGARLIQTAYEQFVSSGSWTPAVDRTARLACLLLTETDHALQGFEPDEDGD